MKPHHILKPLIILAGFLSAILLLQSAGISAQGAERGGEATSVRADVISVHSPGQLMDPAVVSQSSQCCRLPREQ